MGDDTPLKSAYELAMERLRARDRAEGVAEKAPLSESAKRKISKLRNDARAKLAEIEILREKEMRTTADDPEKLREIEEHRAIDRRRVEDALRSAVDRVRRDGRD